MNKTVLIGRMTKDAELRFSVGNGNAVCRFTLAVTRPFKKDETDFINCVAFGKQAETITQYVTKGQQLAISGAIRTGNYDAQDGSTRYTTDVIVDSFDFIGSGKAAETKGNNTENEDYFTPTDDGDMPF